MTSSGHSGALCVFHMGYGKCASSLLQKRVFPALGLATAINPQDSRFEGIGTLSGQRRLLSQIFTCSPEIWSESWLADQLFGARARNFLISEEALFKRQGITSTSHVTAHVSAKRDVAQARGFERFKVLAIHRRQDERVASFYAQMSPEFADAGQEAFESFAAGVSDPLRQRYRFGCRLDYGAQAKQLIEELGTDNVLFLPIELLDRDPLDFLGRVTGFLEIADAGEAARRFSADLGRDNVKRLDARSWQIQPLNDHLRPSFASRLLRRRSIPERDERIVLRAGTAERILLAYESSNRELESLFGHDLASFGYYPVAE